MKILNKYPILTFKIILLLGASFQVEFVAAKSVGSSQSNKHLPWEHNKYCNPYWPFDDCDQSAPVPVSAPVQGPPPSLPPSPPPLLPSLPPIPSGLLFADLRLAVVYPIIQNFKKIITSDPLGITKTWVGSNICSYKGFFCDTPPHNASATAVASIDFNGYGLSAPTLAGFLDQLPDLALFHANSNKFTGILPPNIAKLPYLYELDLSNNLLTGPFPPALVGMSSLEFLDLRFNLFTGSVPPAIFSQNLNVLFLNDNQFVSTLPQSLSQTHILYLTLANNMFTGALPRDIAKALSSITEVLLMNNALTGCMPYELGLLKQVSVLDISHNKLTGPLPFSLACLQKVSVLDLSANLLYGMVPDTICQLPNLSKFSLSDNYFTQVGPFCRSLINNGVLDISNNCIPGLPSQRSIFECTAFFALPKFCPYMDSYKVAPCKPHFH